MIVFPSAPVVPEALLRISVVFATPQDAVIAQRVRLRDDGHEIREPFADPPLWSADRRRLTLLLDPSRQKTGLVAHERAGFVLAAGTRTQVVLDGRVLKTWTVRAGGCAPLDPARWHLGRVRAGTRDRLVVRFGAPIDVVAEPLLAVAAANRARLAGRGTLGADERSWSFEPAAAWQPGAALAVHPRLEDPCGDEAGEPFEHAPGRGLGSTRHTMFRLLDVIQREGRT